MHRNISNQTSETSGDTHYNYLALVFGLILIVFIICGNVLVCLSVCTEKALKTTTNYFIVSLAVADLLLAVLVLPLYVYTEVSVPWVDLIDLVCTCVHSIFPISYMKCQNSLTRKETMLQCAWVLFIYLCNAKLKSI